MIGSTYSRFKTEDCSVCDDVVEDALPCDFCGKMACQACFREIWKECAKCGRRGCREHIEGRYCSECIEGDENEDSNLLRARF